MPLKPSRFLAASGSRNDRVLRRFPLLSVPFDAVQRGSMRRGDQGMPAAARRTLFGRWMLSHRPKMEMGGAKS